MSPFFKREPKLHTCLFCSELVTDDRVAKEEHYKTHLIQVTDNNGHLAFTFRCPRCGPHGQAWGGGRPDPQDIAVSVIAAHLMERHTNFSLID
jgi:hypothetical protein